MLYDRKKTVILNTKAAPFVQRDNTVDNTTITEEKKQSGKVSKIEKDFSKLYNNKCNKVENKNKWEKILTKKCAHKSKIKQGKLEEEGLFNMNTFNQFKNLRG